jgi:hypothetical protein
LSMQNHAPAQGFPRLQQPIAPLQANAHFS